MKRFLLLVLVLLLWLSSALYVVDQADFVFVTQFGRPVATFDGSVDAGLHFKYPWPIQSVQRIDRRLQSFDLPPAELLTHDPQGKTIDKTMTVEAFVCWRIADKEGVDRFVRSVGTPEQAQVLLGQRVAGRLGAAISSMPLDELIQVATPDVVSRRS